MRRYLLLALASLAAFGDCLRGSFHFDDYAIFNGSPTVWGLIQTRPLTQLTFAVNRWLGGTNPVGYHAVNLAIHVAVVLLLFNILQSRIGEATAFIAAGLFALHPMQSEAVAYVFARSTLLATLFCLLSWRCWQKGAAWKAAIWFALALLCKEECVTFPLFLLLIGPRRIKPILVMLGLAAAAGIRAIYATKVIAGSGAGFSAGISPLDYLWSQGVAILRYFRLLVLPWGFTIDPDIQVAAWEKATAWLIVLTLLAVLRRNKWFVGGMILLVPSSSFFPAADIAADRRMYLPLVSFCALLPRFESRRAKAIAQLAGLGLIILSVQRMEVWRSETALWKEAIDRSPYKARPRIQYARTVALVQALDVLLKAPDTADVITERGRVYLELHRPADALREFGTALALRPGDAHAVNNRGVALLALGQRNAARADFERALRIEPNLPDANRNLRFLITGEK